MRVPTPQARATPFSAAADWVAKCPKTALVLVTVLALLPFLGKPFNVDDPLFVWVAQHIKSHPFDPYGFNVNWYGFEWPLWDITKNPPLACYYIALFGGVFGWSEPVLHAAFLPPAIAVILGAHRLAKNFCTHPLLAALAALFTPVFLVSSTTVMCDVLMLAFWVWSVIFWIEGTRAQRPGPFAVAALLMMLAALTKYFGACLIPLLAAWSIAGKRPVKEWLGWLGIPVAFLIAYQIGTRALYGHGLLADAGKYAAAIHHASIVSNLDLILTALSFCGGCLAIVTFFAPALWPRSTLLVGGGISLVGCAVVLFVTKGLYKVPASAAQIAQILLWVSGGVSLLALTIADLYRRRDADSLLLACWVLGAFVFTAFFNWIVNGRSVLPIAIPAGILLARRLEQRFANGLSWSHPRLLVPGLLGAALALWVTAADYLVVAAPRKAAAAVCSVYGPPGHRLWFEGHWGFQYYMEKEGAMALDLQHPKLAAGDYVAIPSHNANVYSMKSSVTEVNTFAAPFHSWLSTLNAETGAGFYASVWGRLPFAFGRTSPLTVTIVAYDASGEMQKGNAANVPATGGGPPANP